MADRPDKPADELPGRPWPLAAVLAVFGVGVVLVALGHWRRGPVVMAAALALAAVLRLVLPVGVAGLLVVRRRWIDVTVLLALSAAIAVLAMIVPGTTSR